MSQKKTMILEILETIYPSNKIKHKKKGFKINVINLRETEINGLHRITDLVFKLELKRSVKGLVIIVTLFPEDCEKLS